MRQPAAAGIADGPAGGGNRIVGQQKAPSRQGWAMDANSGELVPITGPAEDERTGLAILQLLAEAADSPPQSRWVHRRVAQLEFLDTRAVRWRISVDFS